MFSSWSLLVAIIVLALLFDFLNGFHDAANSIATVVSTRVLKPVSAVALAACGNFVAFLFFKMHVATTIGTGLVDTSILEPLSLAAALLSAIIWNIFTWYHGLPSSSSHALIGGLVGAAVTKGGTEVLIWGGIGKVVLFIFLSPLFGFVLGVLLMMAATWLFHRSTRSRADRFFRRLQLLSATLVSLGHGANDAQKTMGIIAMLLFSQGYLGADFYVPLWVKVSCSLAIAVGTLFGGWRVVKTMGMRITKLQPLHGSCAEFSGAAMMFAATGLGIPVSTTHTMAGAILGVGSVQSVSAVRWGIAARIVWGWIVTLPMTALIASLCWAVSSFLMTGHL